MALPHVGFRAALSADMRFLTGCFISAMREAITASRGRWDEARERSQFEHQLDLGATRIIRSGAVDVGFLMLVEQPEALQLHTLCIEPAFQGQGIGSEVTWNVITQGVQSGRRVVLSVLKTNDRAEALYRRLGFHVVSESQNHRHLAYAALTLRLPRQDEEQEFLRAHRATTPEVPYFLHYHHDGIAFSRYLERLTEQARGEHLEPGHVPSTFLFAFDAGRIVGRASVRHSLNDFLLRVGGHVGYVVVPEFRRRGYATAILRLALRIAHEQLGLSRVLVTCDDDNVGSIRTIEKNGGVLENVVTGPDLNKPKRRYWIDVSFGAAEPVDPSNRS